MELYIGDSRDIVVTQRDMTGAKKINVKRNRKGDIVLYDTDEIITAKIENFKDSPAVLTMIQHIPGQWDMEKCTLDKKELKLGVGYKKKHANTLEFEIKLPARTEAGPAVKELKMHYHRRNIRPGVNIRPEPSIIRR